VTDTNPVKPPEKDLPPTQITVSKAFAERVGPEGVRRWAGIVQGVVHDAHDITPDEIESIMVQRLEEADLAGPPVEMRRLVEMLAANPGGEIAFVDGENKQLFGPAAQPGFSAHLEPEAGRRPLYS